MATITKPYTFSTGLIIYASEHNSNFDTIYNAVNGNLNNDNIVAGAGIVGSKLDLSAPGAIGGTTAADATFNNLTIEGSTNLSGGISYDILTLGTDSNDTALTITQSGVGSSSGTGIEIVNNGSGSGLIILQTESSGSAIFINNSGTGNCLKIEQAGVLSATNSFYLYSDVASAHGSYLLKVEQDNAAQTQDMINFDNDGTGDCVYIHPSGVLASSKHGLRVYSDAIQVNSSLVNIKQNNTASSADVTEIVNLGTGNTLEISQTGENAQDMHVLAVIGTGANTNTNSALCSLYQSNAGTNEPVLETAYAGSGNVIQTDSGAGTPAHLNNAGAWTDASCLKKDKENRTEITDTSSYADKIKDLKLFKYQKKWDVYGGMEDDLEEEGEEMTEKEKRKYKKKEKWWKGEKQYKRIGDKKHEVLGRKYKKDKIRPDARYFKGYILDDDSTPDELIARDYDGNIDGISPALGVNFLLGVCKELMARIEILEEE